MHGTMRNARWLPIWPPETVRNSRLLQEWLPEITNSHIFTSMSHRMVIIKIDTDAQNSESLKMATNMAARTHMYHQV